MRRSVSSSEGQGERADSQDVPEEAPSGQLVLDATVKAHLVRKRGSAAARESREGLASTKVSERGTSSGNERAAELAIWTGVLASVTCSVSEPVQLVREGERGERVKGTSERAVGNGRREETARAVVQVGLARTRVAQATP